MKLAIYSLPVMAENPIIKPKSEELFDKKIILGTTTKIPKQVMTFCKLYFRTILFFVRTFL